MTFALLHLACMPAWRARSAVCKRCLHLAEVKPDDVIPTLGWDFALFGMRMVLRCQNCKARGLANVHEAWS